MRPLFLAALLFGILAPMASSGQVHACSCGFPETEADAQALIDSAPLAVVATIDGYTHDGLDGQLVMAVERVLNDESIPPRIVLDQTRELTTVLAGYDQGQGVSWGDDCSFALLGEDGDRYLLIAEGEADQPYTMSACSASNPIDIIENSEGDNLFSQFKPALSEPGAPPDSDAPMFPGLQQESEAEHKDVPWIPILILALAIPTAALVIPAFFMAKRAEDGKGPPG